MGWQRGLVSIVCLAACTQWQSTITIPAHEGRHIVLEMTTEPLAMCEHQCSAGYDRPSGRYALCLASCPGAFEASGTCEVERSLTPHDRCLERRRQLALVANQSSSAGERQNALHALPDCSQPAPGDGGAVACGEMAAGLAMTMKTVAGRCADQHDPAIVDCSERKVDSGGGTLFAIIAGIAGVVLIVVELSNVSWNGGWPS